MLPPEASGLLATSLSSTMNAQTRSEQGNSVVRAAADNRALASPLSASGKSNVPIRISKHQITASTASPSSSDGIVVDFQTTAETALFLSPALFRDDSDGASTVISTIAADINTQSLASAIQLAWNEPHPLLDPNVSSAYSTALNSILATLIQSAQSGNAAKAADNSNNRNRKGNPHGDAESSEQSGTVATSVAYESIDVCCVQVDAFTTSGSNYVSTAAVSGFSPTNPIGNAAGWFMRVVPLASDFTPGSLQPVNGNSQDPDSPGPVQGETNPDLPGQPVIWIPGNSVLQYGDLYGDIFDIASWIASTATGSQPISQSNITIPQTQPAFYLVRYYSGGLADSFEYPLVGAPFNQNGTGGIYEGQQLWGAALISNYATSTLNILLHGQDKTVSDCIANALIGNGTVSQLAFNVSPYATGNWNGFQQVISTVISGLASNLPSCFASNYLQEQFEMQMDAVGSSSGVGAAIDAVSEASTIGTGAQVAVELWLKDSPVDTAYIWVGPPPASPAASVALSPSSAAVTVGGSNGFAATAYDSSGNPIANTSFTWTSSNQNIGQISGTGSNVLVTAVAVGTTTITATAPSGAQASATFTVNVGSVPASPSAVSPGTTTDTGFAVSTTTPTLSWTPMTAVTTYNVAVSASPYGAANVVFENSSVGGSVSSLQVPSAYLQNGTKYRWDLQAINSAGSSAWSSPLYFTVNTGGSAPPTPTPLSPGTSTDTGFAVNTLTPTMQWSGSGATQFELAISQSPYGVGNLVYDNVSVSGSSSSLAIPVGVLQNGVKYRWDIQATNSAGQSAWSTDLYFTVAASTAAPSVASVTPSPVPGSNSAQQITINGSNFQSGATLTYHDPQGKSYPGHSSTFVNSGQLLDPAFNDTSDAGTWTVTVVNPGGQSSTVFSFTVAAVVTPTVTQVLPSPVPALNSNQTVTINGSNFVSGATVTYYDPNNNPYSAKAASVINSGQIVDTAFDDTAEVGTWKVTVTNPGGSPSAAFSFMVE
jgi:hypothetical protein